MDLGQPRGDKEMQVRREVSLQSLQTAVLTKGTETEKRAGQSAVLTKGTRQGAVAETYSSGLFKGKSNPDHS